MSDYVIGDIQGCYRTFQTLLEKINFNSKSDTLWLAGDLVNRGPDSLSLLKWCCNHVNSIKVVLGNHDLHLLSRAFLDTPEKPRDTLEELLISPERHRLLEWLRHQPLIQEGPDHVVVHAGFHPEWTLPQIQELSHEINLRLTSPDFEDFLKAYHQPYSPTMDPVVRAAKIMVRIRTCDKQCNLHPTFSGSYSEIPEGYVAWFEHPKKAWTQKKTYFGHWSGLGLHQTKDATCLDTGCVWGKSLTAYHLQDQKMIHQANCEK